jgi:N-acyl amino acid synthase of PEP-CTERM/exosortase system
MHISEIFGQYFRIVAADTQELREASYRLRYEVYCVENTFLVALDYPDGLETDEYDSRSLHALLQHVPSANFVGTVRLIMPVTAGDRLAMPFADLCNEPGVRTGRILPPASTAEVSRFAISKSCRRRAEDGLYPDQYATSSSREAGKRRLGHGLSLGLIVAVTQFGLSHGITHICAVMDPILLRLLHGLGVELLPIGPAVEYHGLRQPCYANAAELLAQLRVARPEYWDLVTTGQQFIQGRKGSEGPAPTVQHAT